MQHAKIISEKFFEPTQQELVSTEWHRSPYSSDVMHNLMQLFLFVTIYFLRMSNCIAKLAFFFMEEVF